MRHPVLAAAVGAIERDAHREQVDSFDDERVAHGTNFHPAVPVSFAESSFSLAAADRVIQ
jgi:hypothetical protein